MDSVILFRTNSGKIDFVSDEAGEIFVFPNLDAAIASVETVSILQAFPYQIIELDEL